MLLLAASTAAQLLPVPVPPENPITEAKRVLGKVLFWEEQMASDHRVACGTCHMPAAGGIDPRAITANHPGSDGVFGTSDDRIGSPGVRRQDTFGHYQPDPDFGFADRVTDRHSMSVLMSGHSPELFWDGRSGETFVDPQTGAIEVVSGGALETQSLEPLLSDVEMSREGWTFADLIAQLTSARPMALASAMPPDMAAAIAANPTYPDLFAAAFGDPAITTKRIAFALATYQRTLVPDQSKFDLFRAGLATLTPLESAGLGAFVSVESHCELCHPPPAFTDGQFHNLGLRSILEDSGRQGVTGLFADRGKFKTPSLRNVMLRARFFHQGAPAIANVDDVLAFYDAEGGAFAENKDPLLTGLSVPSPTRPALIAFLHTLTDPRVAAEQFPFDRPLLYSETVGDPPQFGLGAPGSGGIIPAMLAVTPPLAGNDEFAVGLHDALGSTLAVFALSPGMAQGSITVAGVPVLVEPAMAVTALLAVAGAQPGEGYATLPIPLPASLPSGAEWFGQWFVCDANAPGGLAATRAVRWVVP